MHEYRVRYHLKGEDCPRLTMCYPTRAIAERVAAELRQDPGIRFAHVVVIDAEVIAA